MTNAKRFARTPTTTNEEIPMATAPALEATPLEATSLEATPPEAGTPDAPNANANLIKFKVDGAGESEIDVEVNLEKVPAEVRARLMHNATRSYVLNRISTAVAAAKKANGPFDTYDAAMKHDPMQSIVKKPDGERRTVDHAAIIKGATEALYSGEVGKRGASVKAEKDPLTAHITRVVVAEVFKKKVATNPEYKYFNAQADVGNDGIAYLRAKIAENVAEGGADAAQQEAYLQERYIKPAQIALGLVELTGKLKGVEGIL